MALIYSKADKTAIDRAVAKARQVKPRVKVLGFGHFEVTGSEGQPYEVRFSKVDGEFTVECGCKANSKGSKPCYHAASVGGIFKKQVADRAADRAALPIHNCHDCGSTYGFALVDGKWFCVECIAERAAMEAPAPEPEPTCYCSECGTTHLASLNICPGCGFNYITRQKGPAPQVTYCTCGAELPLPGDTACADCILDAQKALFGW